MSSEQTFLEVIQANPDDEVPKLIYADWLDEQGDPRGELIRLLVEVQTKREAHEHWEQFVLCVEESFGTSDFPLMIDLLDERQQRLFACKCAEPVRELLHEKTIFREGADSLIEFARDFAHGRISIDELIETYYRLRDGRSFRHSVAEQGWTHRLASSAFLATIIWVHAKMDADLGRRISARFAASESAKDAARAIGMASCPEEESQLAFGQSEQEFNARASAKNQQFLWLVERHLGFKID